MRTGLTLLALLALVLAGCEDEDCCTRPRCPDTEPPAIPSGVYTVTGDELVTVYWNPVLGSDVKGYGIWWSDALPGPYERMANVLGEESDTYVDTDVDNGTTYFYAVTAFDYSGNESELSLEDAFDTPRPAGFDLRIYDLEESPSSAGIDFSQAEVPGHTNEDLLVSWDSPGADLYLDSMSDGDSEVLRFVPAGGSLVQDFGYTDVLDQVDWAPLDGWSESPLGVEVIRGHAYVLQTGDENFAKFRISVINKTHGYVILDWAYQLVPNNRELMPPAPALARAE